MPEHDKKLEGEGLQFPCTIDVKIFLMRKDNNLELVRDVLLHDVPEEQVISVTSRESRHGKYESFSCAIHAHDRESMDDLYRKLSTHPEVVMLI